MSAATPTSAPATAPVTAAAEYYISGRVLHVGVYPLPADGRPMTVKQAITAAGGLDSPVVPPVSVIRRPVNDPAGAQSFAMLNTGVDDLMSDKSPDTNLQSMDMIVVGAYLPADIRPGEYSNMVLFPWSDVRPWVDQSVSVLGQFNGLGKGSDYLVGSNNVYLPGKVDSAGKWVPYGTMVVATGILRFHETGHDTPTTGETAGPASPDFYFIKDAKVSVIRPVAGMP